MDPALKASADLQFIKLSRLVRLGNDILTPADGSAAAVSPPV